MTLFKEVQTTLFILFFMSHLTKKAELASTFSNLLFNCDEVSPSATEPVATWWNIFEVSSVCNDNHSCIVKTCFDDYWAIEGSQHHLFLIRWFAWLDQILPSNWDSVDTDVDKHFSTFIRFKTVSVTCWEGDLHFTIKWCDYLVSEGLIAAPSP